MTRVHDLCADTLAQKLARLVIDAYVNRDSLHVDHDVGVSENLPRHTLVTTLSATDDDQGIYGDVQYFIDSEDVKEAFEVDSATGSCSDCV